MRLDAKFAQMNEDATSPFIGLKWSSEENTTMIALEEQESPLSQRIELSRKFLLSLEPDPDLGIDKNFLLKTINRVSSFLNQLNFILDHKMDLPFIQPV